MFHFRFAAGKTKNPQRSTKGLPSHIRRRDAETATGSSGTSARYLSLEPIRSARVSSPLLRRDQSTWCPDVRDDRMPRGSFDGAESCMRSGAARRRCERPGGGGIYAEHRDGGERLRSLFHPLGLGCARTATKTKRLSRPRAAGVCLLWGIHMGAHDLTATLPLPRGWTWGRRPRE